MLIQLRLLRDVESSDRQFAKQIAEVAKALKRLRTLSKSMI